MTPLLTVQNLKKYFQVGNSHLRAVDDVSFRINPRETIGLVGESGCGKSTLGKTILRLYPPTAGRIVLDDLDLSTLSPKEMIRLRRRMQLIFQDPFASLNPRLTIGKALAEPIRIHGLVKSKAEISDRVVELLQRVGLSSAHLKRYPHEFSGGQRQRIVIARALALQPELIICDEPVSALDVSIQAQIINLLKKLQNELGLAYLFITHDLNVVKHISDRVAVMYLGKIVEIAEKSRIYANPRHPYTQALLSAIPLPAPQAKNERIILKGEAPNPLNPPPGCRFHPRCHKAFEACLHKEPTLRKVDNDHMVACHLYMLN